MGTSLQKLIQLALVLNVNNKNPIGLKQGIFYPV